MAENVKIQGLITDLNRIKNMTDEEIQQQQENIANKNEELQNQIEERMSTLDEGDLDGATRNQKAKDYKQTVKEIETLLGQIEANQQLLEVYVSARVERGEYKDLGIEDMNDFISASETSIDLSIEENEEGISDLEGAREKIEENTLLLEINDLIDEKNDLLHEAYENKKEIQELENKIADKEKEIEELNEKLLIADPEEKDGIAEQLENAKSEALTLTDSKDKLLDRNKEINTRVKEIREELKEKGLESTSRASLNKVYNQNTKTIHDNSESIKGIVDKYGIPVHDGGIDEEDIDIEIEGKKDNIKELMERKDKIGQTQVRFNEQQLENGGQDLGENSGNVGNAGNPQNSIGNARGGQASYDPSLPSNYRNGNIFKRLYNNIKNRFSPEQQRKREEFIRCEHPDWDEGTIKQVANSKERRGELNNLIEKGVSPEVYAKSISSDSSKLSEIQERKDSVMKRGSLISNQVKSFDKLLKAETVLTPEEKSRRDAIKEKLESSREKPVEKDESDGHEDIE